MAWWPQDVGSHERAGTPSTPEWDGKGGSGLSQVGVGVARETGCPVWLSFHAQVINSFSAEPMLLPLSMTGVPGSRSWHAWGWGKCHLHAYPGLQLALHRPLPRWSRWAELSPRLLTSPGSRCSCAEGPPAATCSRKMNHRLQAGATRARVVTEWELPSSFLWGLVGCAGAGELGDSSHDTWL